MSECPDELVDIDVSDDTFLGYAKIANERNITIAHAVESAVSNMLLREVQEENDQLKRLANECCGDCPDELSSLNDTLAGTQKALRGTQDELRKACGEINSLKALVDKMSESLGERNKDIMLLVQDIHKLEEVIRQRTDKIDKVKADKKALKQELDRAYDAYGTMVAAYYHLEAEVKAYRDE